MGWFDEQIKQRKKSDDQVFEDSFASIANAIMGNKSASLNYDTYYTQTAVDQILHYYGFKSSEIPEDIDDFNDQLEYLCRPHGLMRRDIRLDQDFVTNAFGAVLAFEKESGRPIAFIPDLVKGYNYSINNKTYKLTKKNIVLFQEMAICFYKPLPLRKISPIDLVFYAFSTLSANDIATMLMMTGFITLVGLLTPKISYFLTSKVIQQNSINLLLSTLFFMLTVNVSSTLLSNMKSMIDNRINTKMSVCIQAATMMRVLSLPANFFRKYSSGELSQRIGYVSSLANSLVSTILSTTLTSVFSLAYIGSIFEFASELVIPALLIIIATIVSSITTSLITMKRFSKQMELSSKESGMSYAMITGIQKIKNAGAEKRAFARWGNLYAKVVALTYKTEYITLLNTLISLSGTIVMYYIAVSSNIDVASYYAFNSAYGMVSGAFQSLASIALIFANIKPTLEMAKPILDAKPEIAEGKKVITRIQGGIEMNNIYFKYEETSHNVINGLSLKITPGQYVAIVGKTGCGKSTLIRLLLGFETPDKGSIYYDGRDIKTIDLKSLRRKIGVVMQDGKLFQGDIFSNITISAPWLTLAEAWEAAEVADIADDIRNMPMGMNTMITEGSGGVSGGQKQRIMIARAIAPKPRILIFDEATSALDNITQKKISNALDRLKCTRIVIAHRLSTIKHCDRILYLEDGVIKEDGTYEDLIALNGKFAELVDRQRLDNH